MSKSSKLFSFQSIFTSLKIMVIGIPMAILGWFVAFMVGVFPKAAAVFIVLWFCIAIFLWGWLANKFWGWS